MADEIETVARKLMEERGNGTSANREERYSENGRNTSIIKDTGTMGRRGPSRKSGVREANGRLSRKPEDVTKHLNGELAAEEREALRVGVEGRHRLFKLNPSQLRDTDAGSFVGRLRLAGEITMQQCEAAIRFAEIFHDMQATIGGPKPAGAVDLNATHGMPVPENVDRSIQAREDWRAALAAVQHRQNQLRGTGALYASLD